MKAESLLSLFHSHRSFYTHIYIHTHIPDLEESKIPRKKERARSNRSRSWVNICEIGRSRNSFFRKLCTGEGARACFLQRESGDWSRGGEPRPRKLNFAIPAADPGAREEGSDGRARREEGRECGTSESRVPARGDDSSFAARATPTTSDRACLRNTCCRIRG